MAAAPPAPAPPSPGRPARLPGALWVLALAWGIGPALPALAAGELLGQPWTDLYPAVWGLWWFSQSAELLPLHTDLLAHPDGMGFYFSSPLKGTLARLLVPTLGLVPAFNLLALAARVGTVLAAGMAARAWGAGRAGIVAAAAIYGCAPFFHGYAVEGILEGTDGWPLALWAWAAGRGRHGWAAVFVALSIVASWYLGACALLLVGLAGLRDRRAWWGGLGLLLAAPAVWAFLGAFPGGAPLDPAVRAAMGARLTVPRPASLPGIQPFAINTWIGAVALGTVVLGRARLALWALLPAALSLGIGPLYALPGLEMLRFPYRWHAATLALLALAAAPVADGLWRGGGRWRWLGWALGPLVAVEGLVLGPAEPVIPGASAEIPAIVDRVDGPVVDVPGPVALPPGVNNPSRPRARWLLYHQTRHGQPSPWAPDFNSVGVTAADDPALSALRAHDRVAGGDGSAPLPAGTVAALRDRGIVWVMIHRDDPGLVHGDRLRDAILDQGGALVADDGARWLIRLGPAVDAAAPLR